MATLYLVEIFYIASYITSKNLEIFSIIITFIKTTISISRIKNLKNEIGLIAYIKSKETSQTTRVGKSDLQVYPYYWQIYRTSKLRIKPKVGINL